MFLLELAGVGFRLAFGNAQRLPLGATEMFRKQDDLIHMAGIMQQLTSDRLHNCVLTAGDEDLAAEIGGRKRSDRTEDALPATLPPLHNVGSRSAGGDLELLIAMTVRFLAICGEEVRPAGAHVSGHMFYKHGNAVGVGINETKNVCVAGLGERLLGKFLVAAVVAGVRP